MDSHDLGAADIARIRRLSQPKDAAPGDGDGELNVVPFLDIITNVMMFVLATLPAVFTATLAASAPPAPAPGTRPVDAPALNLTLMIVDGGVAIKAAGGAVGTGCTPGSGVAVPNRDGSYDWRALRSCLTRIKASSPELAQETEIKIMAEPGIAYQSVVAAMDAARERDDGQPLFPDVSFSVPR